MLIRTNDGSLEIPDKWHDQSVYIFSSEPPGKPGISLVVTKEKLVNHKDLRSYTGMMLSKLPLELPEFKLLLSEKFYTQKRMEMDLLEYTWKSNYGLMHHFQALTVQQKNSEFWGYYLTMSVQEDAFTPKLLEGFKRIVSTYRIER